MKFKRVIGAALCAAMLLSSTSCLRAIANLRNGRSGEESSDSYDGFE